MKSIKTILQNDKELLDNPKVQELIEYCHELEDTIIEHKQTTNKETETSIFIKELYQAILQTIQEDEDATRYNETENINYQDAFNNLKRNIEQFSKDYKFNLYR